MPTIVRPKKKNYPKQGRSKEASEIYNTKLWKSLRLQYIQEHPLCELCLEAGKTTPAQEIHHKKPILSGLGKEEMEQLAYSVDNLQALCEFHHHQIHNLKRRKSNEE